MGAKAIAHLLRMVVPKVKFGRSLTRWIVLCFAILFACIGRPSVAQTPLDIAGTWQGTVDAGKPARIVLKITKSDGGWKGMIFSIDDSPYGKGVESIAIQGSAVKFSVAAFNASYTGTFSADGSSIQGTFALQGKSPSLKLVRATADTAWALPEPPKPMPTDAKPVFDVVTIKPSSPNSQGNKMIAGVNGRHVLMVNTTLNDIVAFAYSLDPKQIIGGPAWSDGPPYDVDGVPDVVGQASTKQLRTMYQALLATRFQLAVRHEKKELSVFAITLAKNGPKLTKSASPETDPAPVYWEHGGLKVTNETMAEIADVMKYVVEKPVVDQTGLAGRFDFRLKWTPDDAPSSDPNAPPGFFTAIQEQLGLKLEAVKAPVDVLVIDKVERPSAN